MNAVANILGFLKSLLKHHKLKLLAVPFSALLFAFTLFPYNDLSDYITQFVSQKFKVYLQFEDLTYSFPVGASLSKVVVESSSIPTLKADYASAKVGLLSALTSGFARPNVHLQAERIMGGDVDLRLGWGDEIKEARQNENKIYRQKIRLNLQNVNLAESISSLGLNIGLTGLASARAEGLIDPRFVEQPNFEILEIDASNVAMPALTIPGGPGIPSLNFTTGKIYGRLVGGSFDMAKDDVVLGSGKDELILRLSGTMGLRISGASASPGSYNLCVDMLLSKKMDNEMGSLTSMLLANYKKTAAGGKVRYIFRVKGRGASYDFNKASSC